MSRFVTDVSGKVRIWDTVNKEHILKNEFQPIGGPIKDIAWSADSQRMVVVGEGRERYTFVLVTSLFRVPPKAPLQPLLYPTSLVTSQYEWD